jgi:fatty acid desaturase
VNATGILFGLFTLLAIGLGFLWVIKLEHYAGARVAWAVAALGAALVLASLFVPGFVPSAILGVLGGTLLWGATELPAQEKRVAKGLFPANPRNQAREPGRPPGSGETEGERE